MLKIVPAIVICFSVLTAFCQTNSEYQPATVMSVAERPGTSEDDGTAVYDVSVRVGNLLYLVLYNPPPGTGSVKYSAGYELLVKVGAKTITFNDMLGRSIEVPIESSTQIAASPDQPADTESPPAPTKVMVVSGLPGVKDHTKGTITVEKGTLRFVHSRSVVDLPAPSITDLSTGPSRSKLDTLEIRYRDIEGGLHRAVFTMPPGQAALVEQQLIAQGARASAPETSKISAGIRERNP